jgi:hypothetical protein
MMSPAAWSNANNGTVQLAARAMRCLLNMSGVTSMAQALELRVTRKYVDSWKHLDEHRYLGSFEMLSSKHKDGDPEDCCEPMVHKHTVRVKAGKGVPLSDIKQALHDEFTVWGCSHEHDCCGCRSYAVRTVRKQLDGTFVVFVGSSRNF